MTKNRICVVSLTLTLLSGCAVYQPLISHEVKKKKVDNFKAETCVGDLDATPSLKRACIKLEEIESARNTHQYVNAVSTNVLIPATAFVAYRTAKQQHVNSTAAIAAGGVAGYLTLSQLAPGERIEAYSRGTKAISCAIGKYRRGMASVAAERQEYEAARKRANGLLTNWLNADPPDPRAAVARTYIRGIESKVISNSASSEVDASLDEFVGQAIEDLNSLLRGTLPQWSALSTQIAQLSNVAPKVESVPSLAPTSGMKERLVNNPDDLDKRTHEGKELEEALEELKVKAETLMAAETNRVSADFTECKIPMDALMAQGIYKPLMLGPSNSQQGQTLTLEADKPAIVPILGGLAPMSRQVSGPDEEFKPSVEITMDGVALLNIKTGKLDAKTHNYRVSVVDSAGAIRWLDVEVPANAEEKK